jgi:putative tricarboxylic transport membrane protein
MQRVLESEGLAGRVTVDNAPGAAGTVGLARFATADRGNPASLLVTGLVMVGGIVQNGSPVTLAGTTPVARLVGEVEAVVVPADSPLQSLGDLLALVRRDAGSVSWAGGSAGGTDQILVDLLVRAAGADPRATNYVAYSGGGEAKAACWRAR